MPPCSGSHTIKKKESSARCSEALRFLIPAGSALCFDYPCAAKGAAQIKTEMLAKEAGEEMRAAYAYTEIEAMLDRNGFLIYEHLNAAEMTERFFAAYNGQNGTCPLRAPEGAGYLLAALR